jgi:hypothetical protein
VALVQVPVNPVPNETVGDAGTVTALGYVTLIVDDDVKAPDVFGPTYVPEGALTAADGVNFTAHEVEAFADKLLSVKVTAPDVAPIVL